MFTPKFLSVSERVSLIAVRRAAGFGWVKAVRIPRPPAFETAAASWGTPTLDPKCTEVRQRVECGDERADVPLHTALYDRSVKFRTSINQRPTRLEPTYTRIFNNFVNGVTTGIVQHPEKKEDRKVEKVVLGLFPFELGT